MARHKRKLQQRPEPNAQCRHGCLHGARSTPIRIGVPNRDRAAEPADAQGANLIGQWISIIQRTPSSGAKISRRDHDFVIKKVQT